MWWLALPAAELMKTPFGPRGHCFTYVCQTSYNFLSFLEDEEETSTLKGLFAAFHIPELRKEQGNVMKEIAL